MRNFIIFLLLLVSLPTLACNPGQGTGQCGYYDNTGYHNAPIGSNNTYSVPRTITIQLQNRYGAVARSLVTGDMGFVYNETSEEKAKRKALKQCKKNGGIDCGIFNEFVNGCLSVAEGFASSTKSKQSTEVRAGFSTSPDEAEENALNSCRKDGLFDCYIAFKARCSVHVP